MHKTIKASGATVGLGIIGLMLMGASSCDGATVSSVTNASPGASAAGQAAAPAVQTTATVGQIVTTNEGNKYTVFAVKDPAPAPNEFSAASAGNRLIATDVQVCAAPHQSNVSYNEMYVNVVMADNTKAQSSFAGIKPALGSGNNLATGQCARGWVTFEAANGLAVSAINMDTSALGTTLTWKLP
jgi:hypothetical protein